MQGTSKETQMETIPPWNDHRDTDIWYQAIRPRCIAGLRSARCSVKSCIHSLMLPSTGLHTRFDRRHYRILRVIGYLILVHLRSSHKQFFSEAIRYIGQIGTCPSAVRCQGHPIRMYGGHARQHIGGSVEERQIHG